MKSNPWPSSLRGIPSYQWLLLGLLLIPCWVIAAKFEVDIKTVFHVATLSHSHAAASYGPSAVGRFFYGPVTVALLYPLGFLSFTAFKWVWIFFQTVSFWVFWGCLYRLYPALGKRGNGFGWFLLFILSINPIHNNFQSNNIQLMLMAVLLLAEILTSSEKKNAQVFGGFLCALCACIKVFPLFICCYYLFSKPRKTTAGLALGFVISVALPLLVFGYADFLILVKGFLENLSTYSADNSLIQVPDILCLPSLLARWGEGYSWDPRAVQWVTRVVIGLISSSFFILVVRAKKTVSLTPFFGMACLLMALLNPSTRVHYFIFYLPAACSLLQWTSENRAKRAPVFAGMILVTLLIAFTTEGIVGKKFNNQLEFLSIPTWGCILLGVILLRVLLPSLRLRKTGTQIIYGLC